MPRPSSLPSDFEQMLTQQGYDKPLVHALTELFSTVILDKTCRNEQSHGESFGEQLHDLMCSFATKHSVHAKSFEETTQNSHLIECQPFADGQYGTMYQTTFLDKPILTKTTKTFNIDMIREVFVNLVMINSFLLHNQLQHHLVPTIGMYVVPQFSGNQQELYINLVQLCVDGDTLYNRLIKNGITLVQLKEVIGQIFSTLTILHESPFNLRHNDVHTKNIIITTTNQAYLIDWGLATFTYGRFYDLREDNTLENHYYHYEDYRHIGALDMFHIMYTIRDNAGKAPDSPIRSDILNYSNDMLNNLVYQRFWETDTTHINDTHMIRIIGYDAEPIRDINWFYYLLDGLDKKTGYLMRGKIHTMNVALLKEMTYRWFLSTYCTESDYKINWDEINSTITHFQPLIPIPAPTEEEIQPIQQLTSLEGRKRRNASLKRRRRPIDRKRQVSHRKRRTPRKNKLV